MSVYSHKDYREYIREHLQKRPRGGRGELQAIAKRLQAHPTLISQVMSGFRSFTEDQALELSHYLELSEVESEYLLLLVRIEKAGTKKYKNFLEKKLELFKLETEKISKRFTNETEISDAQRSTYYSSWIFAAVRLFTSLKDQGQSLEEIMSRFNLSRRKAIATIEFLCEARLCEKKEELYTVGQQRTYVDRGSIYFQKNHLNWRLRSIEKSENLADEEKLYTVTMGIAEKDFKKLGDEIAKLLSTFSKLIENTEDPDQLVCFNCDLFKF